MSSCSSLKALLLPEYYKMNHLFGYAFTEMEEMLTWHTTADLRIAITVLVVGENHLEHPFVELKVQHV